MPLRTVFTTLTSCTHYAHFHAYKKGPLKPTYGADLKWDLHLFSSCIISSMPLLSSTCHVGVAFYAHRDFPTQWAVVLADNPVFEGRIWRGNAAETINGWCATWTPCEGSPAANDGLNPPVALFSGVLHIAQASVPMDMLQAWIAERNFASELDRFHILTSDDIPYGTAKYVVLALWRLRDGRFIKFRSPDPKTLAGQIRSRFLVLQRLQLPPSSNCYPVVQLEDESGKAFFGRSTPLMI